MNQTEVAIEVFRRYFSVEFLNTESQRNEVFRLRHKVYVEEYGWEASKHSTNDIEKDAFDSRSHFFGIRHLATDKVVACLRLIPANDNLLSLPFIETLSGNSIDCTLLLKGFKQREIAEISRFTIAKEYRTLKGIRESEIELEEEEKSVLPYLGLCLHVVDVAGLVLLEIKHGFAMMELRMLRRLSKEGIHFKQFTPTVEHKGARALCHMDVMAVKQSFPEKTQAWFNSAYDILSPAVTAGLGHEHLIHSQIGE